MDDFIKKLFENVVIKEKNAQKLYIELAAKSTSENLKKLFTRLAEEESVHEELFSKIDLSILKKVNEMPIHELNLLKDINRTFITIKEVDDINNALDFAISEEQKAYDDYSLFLNHIDFSELRDTLKEIARQELRHKMLLQKVKLEFNDNDWRVI